jgi:thiamine-phosphate pyrophosphorylase
MSPSRTGVSRADPWPDDVFRLCLVTSRDLAAGRSLAEVVAAAVAGGVTMVQLREKTASTRAFIDEAAALRLLLRDRRVPLIINDRVDVALAVGADGVHVGQDDMPLDDVRRLMGSGALVGLSITDDADLARPDAAAADYLGVGPIFPQTTKPDATAALGLGGLTRLRALSTRPFMAIGGIARTNAGAAMRAGADGIAVVSAIMAAPDVLAATRVLRDLVESGVRLNRG